MTSLCVSSYLLRYTDVSAFVSVLFAAQTIKRACQTGVRGNTSIFVTATLMSCAFILSYHCISLDASLIIEYRLNCQQQNSLYSREMCLPLPTMYYFRLVAPAFEWLHNSSVHTGSRVRILMSPGGQLWWTMLGSFYVFSGFSGFLHLNFEVIYICWMQYYFIYNGWIESNSVHLY